MRRINYALLAWLFSAIVIPFASAAIATECPKSEWTAGCFYDSADGRRLKPEYLKRVKFQRNGFAVLYLDPNESVAINRNGKVVIPGIVSGQFHYTEAEDGIAAFYANGRQHDESFSTKCGYFQISNFSVVIPPVYDICGRFYRKKAYVCVNCELDCTDCHSYEYYGGEGFVINRKNEVLRRVTLPKIPRCSTVEGRGGFPANQPCRANGT